MKKFNIYTNPSGILQVVKQGWSFPAFGFGIFWCFFKRLYNIGIILFISSFFFNIIFPNDTKVNITAYILTICISGWLGSSGNKLIENNLLKNGYKFKKTVSALNPKSAINKYMNEN